MTLRSRRSSNFRSGKTATKSARIVSSSSRRPARTARRAAFSDRKMPLSTASSQSIRTWIIAGAVKSAPLWGCLQAWIASLWRIRPREGGHTQLLSLQNIRLSLTAILNCHRDSILFVRVAMQKWSRWQPTWLSYEDSLTFGSSRALVLDNRHA
jgi:hypothetical protein